MRIVYIQNVVLEKAQTATFVHSIFMHSKNLKWLLLTQTLIIVLFFLALSFFLMSKLKFLTGKTGKEMFVVDFPNTNLAFIIWLWQPSILVELAYYTNYILQFRFLQFRKNISHYKQLNWTVHIYV